MCPFELTQLIRITFPNILKRELVLETGTYDIPDDPFDVATLPKVSSLQINNGECKMYANNFGWYRAL